MVSLIKKFKNLYKGSYYYANKKYGKYTKRRPFPNFNDFDCSPSGDFSLNEVPDMNTQKIDSEKKNSYINTSNDNSLTVVTEGNNVYISSRPPTTPVNDILDVGQEKGIYASSNSISPVTTISENTEFTMVNSNANECIASNSSSFYQIQNENNPFSDSSEISRSSSYSTTFDGMYPTRTDSRNVNNETKYRNRINAYDDEIKYGNDWRVEMKRYYPSIPRTSEPIDYQDAYPNIKSPEIKTDMKKKKWWKRVIPPTKHKSYTSSVISESTFYNNSETRGVEDNPKRYDSYKNSFNNGYNNNYSKNYSNDNYNTQRYSSNSYEGNLTDGVLVINDKYNVRNSIY
ncbi:hypothetical protein BCR36DRAFT_584634 [Piromyces finnis]|uniref:Uncharacterized protein n=1 Tax=Piromyces finnis TaxID=1754191 RepID=A0A1Y1V5W4_9FUNG|nr:hypothetical protein BCR36DRAFT_584634 [Piromyces finnis]|eukprot:ORX47941.1 hypothetical protein BCR36DRAFT_584634 [Piromyces finnis]